MQIWMPGPGFRVTPVLILINAFMFLVLAISNFSLSTFSVQSGITLGANYGPLVLDGQWWRLLSSLFLHWSLMHLLFNMVSLLFLGRIIEPLIGHATFLTVYLITGICSGLASLYFNQNVVSAGASGAVFGLFGIFVSLLMSNLVRKDVRIQWLKSIGAILAINLAMGLFLPVDNAAHMGGLVSGVVIGLLLLPLIRVNMVKAARARAQLNQVTQDD